MARNEKMTFVTKQETLGLRAVVTMIFIAFVLYVVPLWLSNSAEQSLSSISQRLEYILPWTLLPVTTLLLSIVNMALFRTQSPSDIDAGLAEPTKLARIYQSIIQNTLEQTTLAIPIYTVAGIIFPTSRLIVVPLSSVLFFIGRIAFFLGYTQSAPGRSIGFTLTIIPTLLLLFEIFLHLLQRS